LSKSEVIHIQGLLDRFVGLPLTDVWYMCGRIFEFGEQKHFINSSGEDSYRSDSHIKAINGFVVRGFNKVDLTNKNFTDGNREWTDLAQEFFQLVRSEKYRVETIAVVTDARIEIQLTDGMFISVTGRTWTRENEIWRLDSQGHHCSYDSKGLYSAFSPKKPELDGHELNELRACVDELRGAKFVRMGDEVDGEVFLDREGTLIRVLAEGRASLRIRKADVRVRTDGEEFGDFISCPRVVEDIKIDDSGTVALWFGDWVMVLMVTPKRRWSIWWGEKGISCNIDGLKKLP
jgi:hypothetical protein